MFYTTSVKMIICEAEREVAASEKNFWDFIYFSFSGENVILFKNVPVRGQQ